MANVNLSRSSGRHKKRNVCVSHSRVLFSEMPTNGDTYQLAQLPKNILITACRLVTVVASNQATVATVAVGFDGGATLLAATTIKSAAGTVVDSSLPSVLAETGGTLTLQAVLTGAAATAGEIMLEVEYIEYEQATGELTDFVV